MRKIAIGIFSNRNHLIAVVKEVWKVISEIRFDLDSGISDTVIFHLKIRWRLEVHILRAKQILQNCLELNSSLTHDKGPQSSRLTVDNQPPPW